MEVVCMVMYQYCSSRQLSYLHKNRNNVRLSISKYYHVKQLLPDIEFWVEEFSVDT